jgi:ribose 5-phosphate isomerase A
MVIQTDASVLKRAAAARALDFVQDGMKLGLGTGSTAEAFLDVLAVRVRAGLKVQCAATSERTAEKARGLAIPLADLDALAPLDVVIDGADEADRALTLIKGGGGALLREKIVAASSQCMIVVADASKLVNKLGRYPLPVEVVPFGHATTADRITRALDGLGYGDAPAVLRVRDGTPIVTDSGNFIYDLALREIENAARLAQALSAVPGVVEHGLFVGIAQRLVIAYEDRVEIIERPHVPKI